MIIISDELKRIFKNTISFFGLFALWIFIGVIAPWKWLDTLYLPDGLYKDFGLALGNGIPYIFGAVAAIGLAAFLSKNVKIKNAPKDVFDKKW